MKFIVFALLVAAQGVSAGISEECNFASVSRVDRQLGPEFPSRNRGAAIAECVNAGYSECAVNRTQTLGAYSGFLVYGDYLHYFARGVRITQRTRRDIKQAMCEVAVRCEMAASLEVSEDARNLMSVVARVDGQYDCGLGF